MDISHTNDTIHHRLLQLRDTAIVSESHENSRLSYDCVTDALVAVFNECSTIPSLRKTRDVSRFIKTYKPAMEELHSLRLKEEDFQTMGIIGRGHFGEVRVVKEKSTAGIFAMKVMKKAHILHQSEAAFYLEERDIMAYGQSQWLTVLHYAFQNDHSLFLVMDFHPGGDLFTIMERKEGGMAEQEARFYIAEIIAGLHDLHNLGFIHRDVKPDNVLIARSGHIKLVDFGSASRLDKHGNVVDTVLPVGTPEYISPEVLTSLEKKTEYGACCDWWSVGIILYELLFDVTPFEGDTTAQIYANIMNYEKTLTFPECDITTEARNLIESLLVSSNTRMGYDDIVKHQFFATTDWENLNKSVPPCIPSLTGPEDLSNFDNFDDKDDSINDIPPATKYHKSFTGKDLPFIGFSFMRWTESHDTTNVNEYSTSSNIVYNDLGNMANDIKKALETTQTELKTAREKNSALEKECVIYKSQLEDLHRKLDVERRDRRMSDSKALNLLAEIREQGKVAQDLREAKTKDTTNKMERAFSQLEQERLTAVKKTQRIREEFKKKSLDLDSAVAKVSDLRVRLSKLGENSRRDVDSLQTKLTKVTDGSRSRITELEKENYELKDKLIKFEKQVESLKVEKIKIENKLNSIKLTHTLSNNGEMKKLQQKISEHVKEKETIEQKLNDAMMGVDESNAKCNQVTKHLQMLEGEIEELKQEKETNEKKLKRDHESAKSEILRLGKEKKELISSCEMLSIERDDKSILTKKQEKDIERLVTDNDYYLSKINKLEILCSKQDNTTTNETIAALQKHISHLESERKTSEERFQQAEEMTEKATTTAVESEDRRLMIVKLEKEIVSLKENLSETTSSALRNGEKVTELSNVKKANDLEIARMKGTLLTQQEHAKEELLRSEALTKQFETKYTLLLAKVDEMEETRLKREEETLVHDTASSVNNKTMVAEISTLKQERDKAITDEQKTAQNLIDVQKRLESQELSFAFLKRNVTSLEDELTEANAIVKEKTNCYNSYAEEKRLIVQDLDVAETKVESLTKQLNLEKEARSVLEFQSSDLRCQLEKLTASNSSEIELLKTDLESQKQLSGQYSEKLAELQKNIGLKELYCKETERSLVIERALTTKLYDDLHNIGCEHRKLKASYLKVSKKLQNQEDELKEASRIKEQALVEKATIEESLDVERNRLQTQIAQFNKLVEYTPKVKSSSTKGLQFGRKKRDPAKEVDEWNKLRKLAKERGGVASDSITNSPSSLSAVSGRLSQNDVMHTLIPPTSQDLYRTPLNRDPQHVDNNSLMSVSMASLSSVKTGIKRSASSDDYCTMTHNIPHRWVVKSSRFLKSHTCSSCGGVIKSSHKFSKCACCSLVCHTKCAESVPNTCGLPQPLALQICPISPSKKTKHDIIPTDTSSIVPVTSKENVPIKAPKRLSIDLIRCQIATPSSVVSPSNHPISGGNNTSDMLSITSSMLENSEMDDSDFV